MGLWVLNGFGGPLRRRTANLQACDLHRWCAVRELNPQPADYSHSELTLTIVSQSRLYTAELLPSAIYR